MKRKREYLLEAKTRGTRPRKKTWIMRPRWYTDPVTGARRPKTLNMSAWWEDYIEDPQPNDTHWAKQFRQNFRLPYESFVMLLNMILYNKSNGLFDRWKNTKERNRKNKEVSLIKLLLLGMLRYLGRGWAFDDVHRKFFSPI